MTEQPSVSTDTEITTENQLQPALENILTSAFENGIDFEGSYEIRNGSRYPDVEVRIFELVKPESED